MSKTRANARNARKGNNKQHKAQRTQTRRARTNTAITAPEALQLLESAVSYCQQAGLGVNASNEISPTGERNLALFIPRAQYIVSADGARAAFRLAEETAPGEGLRMADATN